ncbi:MAG TPA: MerR family transcriptional regulator [Rhodocyclaceae bacterium]|nr:MerR family transcriptional regulator [Rhodocyclaceae bacterium]
MPEGKPLYKIGDVADMLATSIRAIRLYEEEGLVAPLRSEGGTRLYSDRHVARLRAILRMAESGYSLGTIRGLAQVREQHRTGDDSQRAVTHQLGEILTGIDEQVQRLQALSSQIKSARLTVKKCVGCRNEPSTEGCPSCPVRKKLPEIEVLNLIWDQDE